MDVYVRIQSILMVAVLGAVKIKRGTYHLFDVAGGRYGRGLHKLVKGNV